MTGEPCGKDITLGVIADWGGGQVIEMFGVIRDAHDALQLVRGGDHRIWLALNKTTAILSRQDTSANASRALLLLIKGVLGPDKDCLVLDLVDKTITIKVEGK